jgi:hypothetical protein
MLKTNLKLVILFLGIFLPATVFAAFEETSVSARSTALGGICAASSDDVYSIYQNPAGLNSLQRTEFGIEYSKDHMGLTDGSDLGYSFIGVAQPLKFKKDYGTLGVGWLRFDLAGLYSENTFILSYARTLMEQRLGFGISLKSLGIAYGSDEYTMNSLDSSGNTTSQPDALFAKYGTAKSNFDADLGLQYDLFKNYRLGLAVLNITEPNMALDTTQEARIPRTYKLGIMHNTKTSLFSIEGLFKTENSQSVWKMAGGAETTFDFGLALRGGLAISNQETTDVSIGIGYKLQDTQFDYALIYPMAGIKNSFGTHRLSLVLKFGPAVRAFDEAKYNRLVEIQIKERVKAEDSLAAANKELAALKAKLQETLDASKETFKKKVASTPAEEKPEKAETLSDIKRSYLADLKQYKKAAQSSSLKSRRNSIKNLIETYKNKLDTAEAEQELKNVNDEYTAQASFYQDSMSYYRKMANKGISAEERADILKRIVDKFKPLGIETLEAEDELNKLSGKK